MQPIYDSTETAVWVIDCSASQQGVVRASSGPTFRAFVRAPGPSEALFVLKTWSAAQSGDAATVEPTGAPVSIMNLQQSAHGVWDLPPALPELGSLEPVRLVRVSQHVQDDTFSGQAIHIEFPINVGFLGDQFGVHPKKTVPDALRASLWDGDAHSYAVIDAASVPNLPERLAASRMPHACLFEGRAALDLGTAAPWLVELAPCERLVRDLFTRTAQEITEGQAPTGLFLRSKNGLRDVKAHLRQFVRLRDEADNWYYFRFWEAPFLFGVFEALTRDEFADFGRLFVSRKAVIRSFGYVDLHGFWHEASLRAPAGPNVPAPTNSALVMTAELRRIFRSIRAQVFVRRLHLHLNEILRMETAISTPLSEPEVVTLVREARCHGLTLEKSIADYARARMMTPQGFDGAPWFTVLRRQQLHQVDFAQAVVKRCTTS